MSTKREEKVLGGCVIRVKEIERDGVPVGIIEGYIATWDIDRGDWFGTKDQFVKGAFVASIMDHKLRNRQIRLKDHHGRTVGGFPIDQVHEDDRGLFGAGEINLDVQQGREAYSLAKQGVLTDFSIGFSIDESTLDEQNELRTISKATIWEGSIVDEPMNPKANITAVKSTFDNLPIADKDTEWSPEKAFGNVDKFANEAPEDFNTTFSKVFLIKGMGDTLIADVVDGKLIVIPKAVFSASKYIEQMEASEGKDDAIKHLEKYYAKMNIASPFDEEQKQFFNSDDVKEFTTRQFEKALIKSGCFSNGAAKFLGSKADLKSVPVIEKENDMTKEMIEELNSITSMLSKK